MISCEVSLGDFCWWQGQQRSFIQAVQRVTECGLTAHQEQGKAGCDTIPRACFNQENEKG